MHFKALKSALIESSKEPKRHAVGALDDALDHALVQRIIEELKSNPAISQKEWKSSWILVDKKPIG